MDNKKIPSKSKLISIYCSFLSMVAMFLVGCGGSGSNEVEFKGSIELDTSIQADHNEVSYPIKVYLPEGYNTDSAGATLYPVMYILDAEWNFDSIVKVVDENQKNIIVVGIGNANAITGRYQRGIDYLLPGAHDFYNYLTLQVIPYIEAAYYADPNDRTLSGHSYGGLFTAIAMLIEPPNNRYFQKYFSQDGSFWRDDQMSIIRQLEQQLYETDTDLPIQLILTGATGFEGNARVVKNFYQLLNNRNYTLLDLLYLENNASHIGDIVLSMDEGLELLYPNL